MKAVDEILAAISALSKAEKRELLEKLSATEEFGELSEVSKARKPALAFDAGQLEGQPDYVLVFDGGSLGNPGPGYGSYASIRASDGKERLVRLDFGGEMTNNEAEYQTLIAALDGLVDRIQAAGRGPGEFTVEARGDSALVLRQVEGTWKTKDERMRALRNRVRELLAHFKGHRLVLHGREESVRSLGH